MFIETAFRIVGKGEGRFADNMGGGFETHFFPFEIAFEGIEEETIVGDREPVKDFLFLLSADALVLE